MIIARAQSVFKTIGVTYSLYARLRQLMGISLYLVDPVTWQERSRKKREGLDIKDWSLQVANGIINHCTNPAIPGELHTEKDKNIADAISMGYLAYMKGLATV